MMELIISKRRRSWEWRVHDQNGMLTMSGRERTRSAARYQGYRSLFQQLAIGRRSMAPPNPEIKSRAGLMRPGPARVAEAPDHKRATPDTGGDERWNFEP